MFIWISQTRNKMFIWITEQQATVMKCLSESVKQDTVMKCLSESVKQDNVIKCLSESVNQGIVNKSFQKWSLTNNFMVSQNIIHVLVIKISSKIFSQQFLTFYKIFSFKTHK